MAATEVYIPDTRREKKGENKIELLCTYLQKKVERKEEIQRIWTAWEKKVRVKTDKETDRKRQIRHKRIRDANT